MKSAAIDIAGLAGLAALVEGAREVYAPAAWVVLGLGLLSFAVVATLRGKE